jgi:intein/homing endonuclease
MKVKKITPKKNICTYDMQIENNHNYVANGLVVHNSAQNFLIETIKPDCFDDVAAINAINRPGPLETFGKVYGQWKRWEKEGNTKELEKIEKDRYPFEFMKKTLSRTYGCLVENELVYNPNTGLYEQIQSYQKSEVQSFKQSNYSYCLESNTAVLDQGIKHVNKYILSTGYELTCTPDHPIVTSDGEMEIDQAFSNNIPILIPKKLLVNNIVEYKEKDKLRLLGLLLGDGSMKSTSVYLTCSSKEIIEDFTMLVKRTYDKCLVKKEKTNIGRKTKEPNYRLYVIKDESMYTDSFARMNYIPNQLMTDLREWGLVIKGGVGKGSYDKFIPDFVFQTDNESKLHLLSGLWDSDGSVVYKNNVPVSANYSTMSKDLAHGVILLLRQLGYLPTISQYPSGVYKILLPLSQFKQISQFCKHLTKNNITFDGIDVMNDVYSYETIHNYIRNEGYTVRGLLKSLDIRQNEFYKRNKPYKFLNDKLKLVFSSLKNTTLKEQSINNYSVIIKSKEEVGEKQVYDLSIKNNPWFVAGLGGITVHNCLLYQEQMMLMVCEAGGFNMGEADSFRRALGWRKDHPKYHTVEYLFEKLEQGMKKKGYSQADTELFLEYCRKFMGYSFNLSHSVSYSYIGMQTLWLKVYYPEYFYANLLTVESFENYQTIIADAIASGIKILFPAINKAIYKFKAEPGAIRVGFMAIKGFGDKASEELMATDFSQFKSLYEILAHPFKKVNTAAFQTLIDVGAFDEFEIEREKVSIVRELYKDPKVQKWFTKAKGFLEIENMPESLMQVKEDELMQFVEKLKPKELERRSKALKLQNKFVIDSLSEEFEDLVTREQVEEAVSVIEDAKITTKKSAKLIGVELEQHGIDKEEIIEMLSEGKKLIESAANEDLLPKPWNDLVTELIPYITFKPQTPKQKDSKVEALLGFSLTLVENLSKLISLSSSFPDLSLKSLSAHESDEDLCYWYLMKKTTLKTKRGKDYYVLKITDGSVTVNAKCWENIDFQKDGTYISRLKNDQWGYMIIVDEYLNQIEL